ncbi:MAG TPA: hypothetical protein DE147_05640, partial [Gammaproteobacteria bacterium]|nr:hypothetical protein [Gammaproteobacteria bacterium]
MSDEQNPDSEPLQDDAAVSGAGASVSQAEEASEEEEEQQRESWFITGANGNLGQRLIRKLLSEGANVTAVVRSTRAEGELARAVAKSPRLHIEVIDFAETLLLAQAAYGAQYAVHLVGILKATK